MAASTYTEPQAYPPNGLVCPASLIVNNKPPSPDGRIFARRQQNGCIRASLCPFKTLSLANSNCTTTKMRQILFLFRMLSIILINIITTIEVSNSATLSSDAHIGSTIPGGSSDLWSRPLASSSSSSSSFEPADAIQNNDNNNNNNNKDNPKNYHGHQADWPSWQPTAADTDTAAAAASDVPAGGGNQWPLVVGDYSILGSNLSKTLAQLDANPVNESGLVAGIRGQLIRQLTSLIMNHEPERIAQRMEGTKISGQLVSESEPMDSSETTMSSALPFDQAANTLVGGMMQHQHTPAAAEARPELASIGPSMLVSGSDGIDDEMIQDVHPDDQVNNETAEEINKTPNALEEQYVTCPPDYEDSSMMIEPSSNLTMEQQQQLLAGADSSGLLTMGPNGTSPDPEAGAATYSQIQQQNSRPQSPCVMPGSRMIEVITKIITPILFSIIIVVGLLGNIIVMIVILEDRKTERELTPTGLLILDLSLADLSFIIFCIPFTAWDYSVGHWVFGSLWCKFNQYLIVVCALSSIYTLVLMSVDRFMAIVYPIECMSYRTSKNTLYAIYIKWILILAMASPTIAMHGLIDSPAAPDQFTCRFLADQYNPLHFQIVFFITSYLFPLILIFCLYLSLLNKLWFGSKPHGHKESLKTLESKKKVTWLVAGIVVVFALCWCPIQVMLILMRLRSHKITATYVAIQVFSHTLGYMNSCVNPIVYAFASESFHNSFKRSSVGRFFYLCFCCKNSHHQNANNHHNNANNHDRNPTNFRFIHHSSGTNANAINHTAQRPTHLKQDQQQPLDHIQANRASSLSSRNEAAVAIENTIGTSMPLAAPPINGFKETKLVNLPLEPRDRLVTRTGTLDSPIPLTISATTVTTTNNSTVNTDTNTTGPVSTLQQQQQAPAKQQLVAHMVQSGNQVSHRCEPCYQQQKPMES